LKPGTFWRLEIPRLQLRVNEQLPVNEQLLKLETRLTNSKFDSQKGGAG
jgi:hypothetical protein